MPPKRRTKRHETDKERISRRMKSTMRQFPNWVGKMITEFSDLDVNDYKDRWELLEKNHK